MHQVLSTYTVFKGAKLLFERDVFLCYKKHCPKINTKIPIIPILVWTATTGKQQEVSIAIFSLK